MPYPYNICSCYHCDWIFCFQKTEIKGFSLTFVKADITNIIRETFSRFIPAADQNNIDFSIELPEEHLYAYVDSEALIKILSNLFSNAIKYAEKKVFVRLLPFARLDKSFKIIVKNDGFIIPHEMKDKIFEPFFRLVFRLFYKPHKKKAHL